MKDGQTPSFSLAHSNLPIIEHQISDVASVTIHYESETNWLLGISMHDSCGTILFKTFESQFENAQYTLHLQPDEVLVGFQARMWEKRKVKKLNDFRLVVMRDVEKSHLKKCDVFHRLVGRVLHGQTVLKRQLFQSVMEFD